MSGLLALLDDVAAIAKIAAASVDDVAANAAKAGSKAVGVLIDDAAVTPKYVTGMSADRELPMIGRIALGSLLNKALLIPVLVALNHFLPMAIPALLIVGGAYLCFEGAEKIWHALMPHSGGAVAEDYDAGDPVRLEEKRVGGAIKTDFILSAEIMTLSLSVIEVGSVWMQLISLVLVGLVVTFGVYGVVAIIVKLDDMGLWLSLNGRLPTTRGFGEIVVRGVPVLLWLLTIIGTAAMLWVGGNIVIHSMHTYGVDQPYQLIHDLAGAGAALVPPGASGAVGWAITALCDGVFGLLLGSILIPVGARVVGPLLDRVLKRQVPVGNPVH